ncbi:MAG: hypothetical protein LBH57_05555 [Treponema sp.]|jgi:hypothetical protein|nr:hypothetical protein [Treponema sp.]
MNRFHFPVAPLLWGALIFTACLEPEIKAEKPLNPEAPALAESGGRGSPALPEKPQKVYSDVDGLSGATIAKPNSNTVAYIDNEGGFKLKTVDVNNAPLAARNSTNLALNAQVLSSNGTTTAILTALDGDTRKIELYDSNFTLTRTIATNFSAANVPLHHAEAAFSLSGAYVLTGYDNEAQGKTYISVYDALGTKNPTHTETNADIGELVSLALNGNFLIAGGDAGTGVYEINPLTLAITKVGNSDGEGSHWMKDNGTYVIESKEAGAKVTIWKWNGASKPTALGTISIPGTEGDLSAVRALQFDPVDSKTAYMVSFTGGQVYKVDLSSAKATLLFTYPGHAGAALFAWMIEKASHTDGEYFVITGGYGSQANPREARGLALVFKNPPLDGGTASPLEAMEYQGLVRMLRTLRGSGGSVYFAAKDRGASEFSIYQITN